MSEAKYNVFDCIISAPFKTTYKYTCEQMVFPGWKIIDKNEEEEEYKNKIYNFMKLVKSREETFETDLVMYSSDSSIGSKVNYNQISYPNKQRKSLSEYYKLMKDNF